MLQWVNMNILEINEKKFKDLQKLESLSKEMEDIKRNQMEILELKKNNWNKKFSSWAQTVVTPNQTSEN